MHANPLGVFLFLTLFLLSSHPFPNTPHLILEYGDGMFFRNFGIQPKYYAAQPTRPQCNFPVYLAFQLVAFKEVFIRDYVWLFFHPCHASNASVSTASLIQLWGYYCCTMSYPAQSVDCEKQPVITRLWALKARSESSCSNSSTMS
jgi:hypothetical protein